MKNHKIVFTSNTSFSLYNFRYGVMKYLKDKGFEVIALAPKDDYSDLLKKNFEFFEIKSLDRKGTNPIVDFKLVFEYMKVYKIIKPNLVFSYTIKPNVYSSFACRFLKIKHINMLTGLGYIFIKENILTKFIEKLYKTAFVYSYKVLFLNKDDMELFINRNILTENKAILVRSEGINAVYFSPDFCKVKNNGNKLIFLMITRLLWDKGVKEFVEAGKIVKSKCSNAEFWLLGPIDKDNPSSVSECIIEEWAKEGAVKYVGVSKDVRGYICEADVVVLPSYREGVPRSLIEAMAMGKPIITTDTSGCRDVCRNDENGFLVPVKDAQALSEAMIKMIQVGKEGREQMGQRGRNIVIEEFDEKIIIKQYMNLIEEVFGKI